VLGTGLLSFKYDARTVTDVLSISFTNFKRSMHPTLPMLAFQLMHIPENFSEALASPAYMVATPMTGKG